MYPRTCPPSLCLERVGVCDSSVTQDSTGRVYTANLISVVGLSSSGEQQLKVTPMCEEVWDKVVSRIFAAWSLYCM